MKVFAEVPDCVYPPEAAIVVNAPVVGVEAPTVPLMLILAVPVKFVTVPDDGVPSAGVINVGEVARTESPVPVQVKSDVVATLVASAVEPVMLARTLPALTCARFANGRSPVMASVSARSRAPQA